MSLVEDLVGNFAPPPPILRKGIYLLFYRHFEKCPNLLSLSYILPRFVIKILIFNFTAKYWRLQGKVFGPPPTPRNY